MNKGRQFLQKLLIIGTILVLADMGIGKLLQHFYFTIERGEQRRLTYTLDSTHAATLILGSSRASHHYVADVIADSLHTTCYNAGKDNQGIFYNLAVFSAICKRYRPQNLILDLNPIGFNAHEAGWDDMAVLLPYYHQHPEIQPIINKRSRWEWLKTRSSLYCFNSLVLQIMFDNLSDRDDPGIVNGYIPEYNTFNHRPSFPFSVEDMVTPADTSIVRAFEDILRMALRNGCKPVVVVSPFYFLLPGSTSTIRTARAICGQYHILFFDYSQSPAFFNHASLFDDELHLNNAGAQRFTRQLCSDLVASGLGAD